MDKHLRISTLTTLLLVLGIGCFAQTEEAECGLLSDKFGNANHFKTNMVGGIYMTAKQKLQVLVIFASFPDDDAPHSNWPAHSPPNHMSSIIDPDTNTGTTRYANITNYFRTMSLGDFEVVGEAVYVETPHNRSYYGYNRGLAHREVFQNLSNAVGPQIDLNRYDNWQNWRTNSDNYNIQPGADGLIDMVVVVWRGLVWSTWAGEATLGYGTSVEVDGKTFAMGYPEVNLPGSGVTVHYRDGAGENYMFKSIIHEMGHWLLGSQHPYGYSNPRHSIWGILTRAFDGIAANTYERERLGWITPVEIDSTQTVNIPDYITSGVAYKYRVQNGVQDEYFYFENHQKLESVYDDATVNPDDKGVFVLHQKGPYRNQNNIRVNVASGNWEWINTAISTACYAQALPVFQKKYTENNGTNHRATQRDASGSWHRLHVIEDENGLLSCGNFSRGWGLAEAFNRNSKAVFSPWGNPNSNSWDNNPTDFAMAVIDQSGSELTVRIFSGNPEDAPPAKPEKLVLHHFCGDCEVLLRWEPTTEPRVIKNGKYEIYRAEVRDDGDPPEFKVVATIDANDGLAAVSKWRDAETQFIEGPVWLHYQIKAVDNAKQSSLASATTKVFIENKDDETVEEVPEISIQNVSLAQNYPNPFNPVTTIRFSLPVANVVRLTVYNISGELVKELLNKEMSAGIHNLRFDFSEYASGVYFYRIEAGRFSDVRKMVLLE